MKKQLLLLRHAEAQSFAPGKTDHERTLTPNGIQQAHTMANQLSESGQIPDIIYASDSQRTTSTAEIFAQKLNYPPKNIIFDASIYETTVEVMLWLINKIPDQHQLAMMIGHNPTISYLTEYLIQQSITGFPTCGMAFITFETTSWSHVSSNMGVLNWMKHP